MTDGTDFSFETLSKQEAQERKQPRLTQLDPSFWEQLQKYLRTLETSMRKEQERNPTSRKIALLQDELRNATRKMESLWETREKKITMYALKSSRTEVPPPPENALAPERALYEELVAAIRKHVPRVVQMMEKATEAPPVPRPSQVPVPAPVPPAPPVPVPQPSMPAASAAAAPKTSDDAVTVRALVDVPPFVGLDGKTYRLKKGDVLTLPRKMVEVLTKRGQVALLA